jgi:hypothetical protein
MIRMRWASSRSLSRCTLQTLELKGRVIESLIHDFVLAGASTGKECVATRTNVTEPLSCVQAPGHSSTGSIFIST